MNPVNTFNTSMLLALAISAPNSEVTIVFIRVEFSFKITNTGSKSIKGVQGTLVVKDLFHESIISIDYYAFAGCKNLTDVYLSERVTRVGLDAFVHTPFYDSLTDEFGICGDILIKYNGNGRNIVIPKGVRVIADGVFAGRLSITSVTFPESLQYIGNSAFRSCKNLESVFFVSDDINLTIGRNAFDECSLSKGMFPIIKLLTVDERNITITEKNKEFIKKSPFSIISFIINHSPLGKMATIKLSTDSTNKNEIHAESFSAFNTQKHYQKSILHKVTTAT